MIAVANNGTGGDIACLQLLEHFLPLLSRHLRQLYSIRHIQVSRPNCIKEIPGLLSDCFDCLDVSRIGLRDPGGDMACGTVVRKGIQFFTSLFSPPERQSLPFLGFLFQERQHVVGDHRPLAAGQVPTNQVLGNHPLNRTAIALPVHENEASRRPAGKQDTDFVRRGFSPGRE